MIEKELLDAKEMTSRAKVGFETFNDPSEKRPLVLDNPKWLVRIGIVVHDDVMSTFVRTIVAKHLDNASAEILEALKKQEALIENKIQSALAAQIVPDVKVDQPPSIEATPNANSPEPIKSRLPVATGTDPSVKAISAI